MYFNEKDDTNIDSEFKKSNKFSLRDFFNKFKIFIIIIGALILFLLLIWIISLFMKDRKKYFISLEGDEVMTIYQGTEYNEPGYKGYDNKGNTYKVEVEGNVDGGRLGSYILTYKLKTVSKSRTVNVVIAPEFITWIHLNGEVNMTIKKGTTYKEEGFSAVDTLDGDLTDKVKVTGTVDTSKQGVYRLVYSVVNSSGVTSSTVRTVIVD